MSSQSCSAANREEGEKLPNHHHQGAYVSSRALLMRPRRFQTLPQAATALPSSPRSDPPRRPRPRPPAAASVSLFSLSINRTRPTGTLKLGSRSRFEGRPADPGSWSGAPTPQTSASASRWTPSPSSTRAASRRGTHFFTTRAKGTYNIFITVSGSATPSVVYPVEDDTRTVRRRRRKHTHTHLATRDFFVRSAC